MMEAALEGEQIILILPDGTGEAILLQEHEGNSTSVVTHTNNHNHILSNGNIDSKNNNNADYEFSNKDQDAFNNANLTDDSDKSDPSGRIRFKWTKEKSEVALNLVKHGYKPKLISIALGCSLRTSQKFVETVTPKMKGEDFKEYPIKQRGRHKKDVSHRLEAIKQALSKDGKKTQIEIAADLKVSNTTVCRDLKKIGKQWRSRNKTDSRKSGRPSSKKHVPSSPSNKKTSRRKTPTNPVQTSSS